MLEWKNAQKKETKNKTSEIINNNTPNFNPFNTLKVWCPCNVLSRIISRHHWYFVSKIIKIPKNKIFVLEFIWNNLVDLDKTINKPNEPVKGHGL